MGLHREGARLDLYLKTLAGLLCEEHRNPDSQLLQQPRVVKVVFGTHSGGHEQKWTDSRYFRDKSSQTQLCGGGKRGVSRRIPGLLA